MNKLPILISIPHGGTKIPHEIKNNVCLNPEDLFDDGDAFTKEIYDLGNKVSKVIYTDIARAFVDLNRSPDDLPPKNSDAKNSDGLMKSHTCYGKLIYKKGFEPDKAMTETLLEKYYFPYHKKIQKALNNKDLSIEIALDCHSMAAVGPVISPDKGKKRPMICLGNVFGQSASQKIIEDLASCFRKAFELKDEKVSINNPFAGGYITKKYGNNKIPWIQVELNREFYLHPEFFDRKNLSMNMKQIYELRKKFEKALCLFYKT